MAEVDEIEPIELEGMVTEGSIREQGKLLRKEYQEHVKQIKRLVTIVPDGDVFMFEGRLMAYCYDLNIIIDHLTEEWETDKLEKLRASRKKPFL
jgi:hypothetical protein